MLAVYVFFLIFGGRVFAGSPGTAAWLNVAAEIGIVALPIGLLMIAGHLDLSIGAIVPAASLTVAIVSGYYGAPDIIGIAAALAVGLLVGFVNGFFVIRTEIPSLIVTIGKMFVIMGLTLGLAVLLTGSTSTSITPGAISKALRGQFIGGMFQVTIFWWAVFAAIFIYVLHVSAWGN